MLNFLNSSRGAWQLKFLIQEFRIFTVHKINIMNSLVKSISWICKRARPFEISWVVHSTMTAIVNKNNVAYMSTKLLETLEILKSILEKSKLTMNLPSFCWNPVFLYDWSKFVRLKSWIWNELDLKQHWNFCISSYFSRNSGQITVLLLWKPGKWITSITAKWTHNF